ITTRNFWRVVNRKGIFISCTDICMEMPEVELEKRSKKVLLVITGGLFSEAKKTVRSICDDNGYVDLYVMRFIKPFDETYFIDLAKNYEGVVFAEDGVIKGGIGEYLSGVLAKNQYTNTKVLGFDDKYYSQGNREEVLTMANISSEAMKKAVKNVGNKIR
ncbi:MAG: hypothetical protein MJZ37_10960, partial [Bacilli bacterium]|nr:hypothetical protein [Bacilli bacterium]